MTKFSIVLPTYNVSKYIDRCLTSCINQTYTDFEIIIVDDCGQDNAIDKAKRWEKKDSRIKIWYHEKNLGTYHARHSGVKIAKGEYVIFLDPDDALELNALEELYKLTVSKPDILLFGSRYIPEKKMHQVQSRVPNVTDYKASPSDIKNLLSLKGFGLGTPGKAYNKKIITNAFSSLNIPTEMRLIYGEDVLLFSEVIADTQKINTTQEKIYLYHQEKSSITKTTDLNAVRRNMEQLKYVICMLKNKINSVSEPKVSYGVIITRLSADLLVLENKTNITYLKTIENYVTLSVLTKNIRWLAKAALYMVTFGIVKY